MFQIHQFPLTPKVKRHTKRPVVILYKQDHETTSIIYSTPQHPTSYHMRQEKNRRTYITL